MRYALFTSVLVAVLLLGGCGHHLVDGGFTAPMVGYTVPAVPQDLRECFAGVTGLPPGAEWDRATVVSTIAKLRSSELSKTDCGRRLLKFYDDLAARLKSP